MKKHNWWGPVLLAPALLLLMFMYILPTLYAARLSFYDVGFAKDTWLGLENFRRLLSKGGWVTSMQVSGKFLVLVLFVSLIIAYILALALRKFSERFCRMILTLYYIPTIFAGVVTVAVWRWFYRYPNGGLNNILDSLHLPTISWLGTPITAPWALGFLMMGTMFGFSTLLYVAAIGQIDLELLGAAKIDGANEFQLIWYIITPLTHRVRLYITLISTVGALSIWEHPFFYTGGGPIGSTTTVLLKVYQEAFARDNIGLGSAMTTVTTSIILIFAIFGVRYFREFLG